MFNLVKLFKNMKKIKIDYGFNSETTLISDNEKFYSTFEHSHFKQELPYFILSLNSNNFFKICPHDGLYEVYFIRTYKIWFDHKRFKDRIFNILDNSNFIWDTRQRVIKNI